MPHALGIDVGGTFIDAVASDGAGRILSAKSPMTPPNREVGVMRAIEDLAGGPLACRAHRPPAPG